MLEKITVKKVAGIFLAIILFCIALFQLYQYLTKAELVLQTSNPDDYVKVEKAAENIGGEKTFFKQAKHRLSLRLSPGNYNLYAYGDSGGSAVSQTVQIKPRQKLNVTLNPTKMTAPEPVYGRGVSSVFANSNSLTFIDSVEDQLKKAGKDGRIASLYPGLVLRRVAWIRAGYGVAENYKSDRLYVLKDGQKKDLVLPSYITAPYTYDVSTNGHLYVASGKNVYYTTLDGLPSFEKIYTADSTNIGLVASLDKVAVLTSPDNQPGGYLAVINIGGKTFKKNVFVTHAAWSPDGKYLLAGGEGSSFLANSSLDQVSIFPINDYGLFIWKDAGSFFYARDSELWVYDVLAKKSHKLSGLPAKQSITGIFTDQDESYVYFTAQSNKPQLFRAGLRGQPVSTVLSALSVIMPENLDYCALNFINFTKPTILLSYPENHRSVCLLAANTELSNYGVPPSDIIFQLLPFSNE